MDLFKFLDEDDKVLELLTLDQAFCLTLKSWILPMMVSRVLVAAMIVCQVKVALALALALVIRVCQVVVAQVVARANSAVFLSPRSCTIHLRSNNYGSK